MHTLVDCLTRHADRWVPPFLSLIWFGSKIAELIAHTDNSFAGVTITMVDLRELIAALVTHPENEARLLALGPNVNAQNTRGTMYASLCRLRIYPYGDQYLTVHGAPHGRLRCQYCRRPLRLFGGTRGASWDRPDCAVCDWKRRNPDVARIVTYQFWPNEIHPDFRSLILAFLCWEEVITSQGEPGHKGNLAPITPLVASVGHARAWHSVILTGVRSAVYRFPYVHLPLTGPNTSECKERQHDCVARALTIERWAILVQLWENPLWRLALSCHYRSIWSQTRTGQLEAGRPLHIMLSFLGPA